MRTIEVAIRKYAELPADLQEKAYAKYGPDEYHWADEALSSIKALAKYFDGELRDYQIDWLTPGHSSLTFSMPEMTQKEIKAKLGELGSYNRKTGKGHGECKLTGVCFDENAIDGFRLAWRAGERDLTELMRQAGEEWLSACMHDYEYQLSEESFRESCEANEWEFDEDGNMV